MAGLVPAIHVLPDERERDVYARHKAGWRPDPGAGHDESDQQP